MNISDLNYHIKNYLENDKTNTAIMLTGAWGVGKSYYIKNELIPYLDLSRDLGVGENDSSRCVTVSLYGITELKDISKSIFLEMRAKPFNKKSENVAVGKIVAKTIIKGIAGRLGVDINLSNEDWQTLYESIDLTGKLIILEDLERCSINIVEVLGFVNNLVEQDGVKVLLVANEDEIIQYEDKEIKTVNNQTKKESCYTAKTREYLRKKEKTVSDTLYFEADIEVALKNIIKTHFNKDLYELLTEDKYIADIVNVLNTVKSNNLRSVMFACQKTSDLIKLYEKSLDADFVKSLLCSNIAFSCRIKNGASCEWEDDKTSPVKLGTDKFPLYKAMYNFIQYQYFDASEIKKLEQVYLRSKKISGKKTNFNRCLEVLKNFYYSTEKDVSDAIAQIKEILKTNDGVECEQYAMLANYLIAVRDCVDNNSDIDECKKLMLINIQNADNESDVEYNILYHSGIVLEEPEKNQELADFKSQLMNEIKLKKKAGLFVDFTKEKIYDFINYVNKNYSEYINERGFAKHIPIDKLIDILKSSSPYLIAEIRGMFVSLYRSSNVKDFMSSDRESIELLKKEIEKLKDSYDGFDKIQKKQLYWFVQNLEDIIESLS